MKVKKYKNGTIKMTAENKRDSLNLLKFISASAGNDSPEREALIQKKEIECKMEENGKN